MYSRTPEGKGGKQKGEEEKIKNKKKGKEEEEKVR